jgi:glucose-1-phosphate adenylyltransferase
MLSLNEILAIILGGGRGSRLYPLTQQRSKPAVPIAGKYRLIDIPISNCINSQIYRIAVLTQFNSVSLNRHISNTYTFDAFHPGWVQIWAAQQTMENTDWYQGTADAVRKQLIEIRSARPAYVLILAGDHLYRMDYSKMALFHWENEADITIAVKPTGWEDASRFGLLKRDPTGRIIHFVEKPKDPAVLENFVSRDDPQKPFLASMGIYLFNIEVLFELLADPRLEDFGGQVIPKAIQSKDVFGYDFEGYWEDIGTIRSFYETNLALCQPDSPFNLYEPDLPIYTHPRFLPGSIIENSVLENVLLSEGCRISNAEIHNSVVGVRSQIHSGVRIVNSILMGADYYERSNTDGSQPEIPIGIGRDCQIEGAIIDKNARLGPGVIIHPFPEGEEITRENWMLRDGIVVVPKNAVIPAGTVIGPGK